MALTAKEAAALAIIGINEVMLKGQGVTARSIKSLGRAAVKLTPWLARGAVATAPGVARTVGTLAAANPISTGVGLGASFLASQPGQQLLGSAEQRGAMDRIRAQQMFDEWWYTQFARPGEMVQQTLESPTFQQAVKAKAKRKVSKYNRAVKLGMKAVKASKFHGKPGKLSNPKKTFATVAKTASKVLQGKIKGRPRVKATGLIKRTIEKAFPGIVKQKPKRRRGNGKGWSVTVN